MEIDVTRLFEGPDSADDMGLLSGSQAELGENAGQITWENSLKKGRELKLLTTEEQFDAARDYFKSMGGWDGDDIDDWNEDTLNGMFVQEVAARAREYEEVGWIKDDGSYDWDVVRKEAEEGSISHCLWHHEGKMTFYLGH